jgi:hypothetical protein
LAKQANKFVHPLAKAVSHVAHTPLGNVAHPASHPSVGSWLMSNALVSHVTAVQPLLVLDVHEEHVAFDTTAHGLASQQSEAVHVVVAQVFVSTSFK